MCCSCVFFSSLTRPAPLSFKVSLLGRNLVTRRRSFHQGTLEIVIDMAISRFTIQLAEVEPHCAADERCGSHILVCQLSALDSSEFTERIEPELLDGRSDKQTCVS